MGLFIPTISKQNMDEAGVKQTLENANELFSNKTFLPFLKLINRLGFLMQDPIFHITPWKFEAAPPEKDDLQILFNGDTSPMPKEPGHWLCAYFKATEKKIYIYDSLYTRELDDSQKGIVLKLYPSDAVIKYVKPLVLQSDGTSCGSFAIAYAITIALGKDPAKLRYKLDSMRQHLLKILDEGILSEFPVSV